MLILASASSARSELLKKARIPHRVIVSGIDEARFHRLFPEDLAQSLSLAKASEIRSKIFKTKLKDNLKESITSVLGCDSVFVFEGEVLGKPRNNEEAFVRLKAMALKSGRLITGHSLFYSSPGISKKKEPLDKLIQTVIGTTVKFSNYGDDEIWNYISSGEPLNCAGGFALEGMGGQFIESIDGCYSNVIGLSLPWLRNALTEKK